MTTFLYLVTYTAIARNVTPTALATALSAIPRDTDTETLLGLVSLADVMTTNPPFVTRAMSYTSSPSAIIPNPQLGAFLANFYTVTFTQKLGTPVVASPVSTAKAASAPVLWTRADAGAPNPITDWRDLSGHARDLLQELAEPVPALAVFAPLEILVASYVGTQILATAAGVPFDAFTYLATIRSPLAATPGFLFERSIDATAQSGENLYNSTGAQHSVLARRNGVVDFADLAANWGIDGNFHLVAYTYDVTHGGAVFVDSMAAPAASFAGLTAEAVSARLFVGARTGVAVPFTGDLRELMVFDTRFDPSALQAIAPYLKGQVGL
ncbi:MAG: hypothetical protein ACRDNM_00010 [Gaiellaceae bacterium]